jgi:hypothetical protein
MTFYDSSSGTLFDIVGLFGAVLRQLLTVPELALFLGTALLLVIFGVFSRTVRQGKRL